MSEVSKFIPMDEYSESVESGATDTGIEEVAAGNVGASNSSFKVCGSSKNLPAQKTSLWAKLKGILTYEIKVELTPHQQKIEDEINEFLHQEVTWQSFKNFLFQDVTFGKKKNA